MEMTIDDNKWICDDCEHKHGCLFYYNHDIHYPLKECSNFQQVKSIETIDEARTALGKERKYALHENKQAFDIAIDIMRKYQKIQEIIADWKSDGGAFEMSEPYWLRLISEVVENGKID